MFADIGLPVAHPRYKYRNSRRKRVVWIPRSKLGSCTHGIPNPTDFKTITTITMMQLVYHLRSMAVRTFTAVHTVKQMCI